MPPPRVSPEANSITREQWDHLSTVQSSNNWSLLLRSICQGGVSPSLRPTAWPFLLGCIPVTSTQQEQAAEMAAAQHEFQRLAALSDEEAGAMYTQQARASLFHLTAPASHRVQLCASTVSIHT